MWNLSVWCKNNGCTHTWAPPKFQQEGAKKLFQGGGLQKKTQGGGLFSQLRVWVARGMKENVLSATAIFGEKIPQIEIIIKLGVFLTFFLGQGGESPGKCHFFLYWGGQFLPQGGTTGRF